MILRETTDILREIELLLESCKVGYAVIPKKYREELEKLSSDDSSGNQSVLSEIKRNMFAGMGSLNDVWISEDNGHVVKDEVSVNKELERLRNKLRQILENY
ncbi:MAG: hypothetical protein G3M70_04825 [Candidatus Nitronauta litoralis]|uniref:DUF6966 domain-containing protein n=1 Tax=Candidatus Nitronauta litoralis TaxID=2705533 RepID=A0A7T0FZX9_9BACT|nr:MAG: hypothetical protein G3M70_04825 [Candidatus Nitronauta litoralis]